MASSTPATPISRRSSSLPAGRLTSSSPDPQIEILFTLPSVRIISFTTSSKPSSRLGSTSGASTAVEEEPGTLSWTTRFERTIAVGPLRIYRAPGSVAFLSCVSALRPILPKSQAWCVDGNSKFVLQIRPPQYWRIEVPNKTGDEARMIEELKNVLGQVLRYEKTPCPFQRDFVVELPEEPRTPVKKRPWRPVERTQSGASPKSSPLLKATPREDDHTVISIHETRPSTPCTAPQLSTFVARPTSPPTPLKDPQSPVIQSGPEKQSIDDETAISSYSGTALKSPAQPSFSKPISSNIPQSPSLEYPDQEYVFGAYTALDERDSYSEATDDTNITPRSKVQAQYSQYSPLEDESTIHNRPQSMQSCSRSVTAPPVLSLITSPPSKERTQSPLRCSTTFETSSDCSSSVESFHSVQSWHSPLAPPSPPASQPSSPTSTYPYPHENIILSKRQLLHSRDTSELTVTPETPRVWDMNASSSTRSTSRSLSPPPRTPPTLVHGGSDKSDEEQSEIATPPTVKPSVRHRATTSSNSRRRALSPLPAAVNLFSPPRRRERRLRTSRHLPTAIIQKTCEILLSPPSNLFHLMLSIASKIAAGEWRGVLSGHGESVHWDFEDEYGGNSLYEDDYGMSLAKTKPSMAKTSSSNATGGSWEVD